MRPRSPSHLGEGDAPPVATRAPQVGRARKPPAPISFVRASVREFSRLINLQGVQQHVFDDDRRRVDAGENAQNPIDSNALAPGVLVVAEPVRVRIAGLGEVERDSLDHCGEREDRQGFAQVAPGEPHDLGAADLDRRGDGLDPLGHRPAAVEHHQRVTPVEGHAGAGIRDVALVAAESKTMQTSRFRRQEGSSRSARRSPGE